jgi:pyrroline-5-carboxylate reductase
MKISIIGAGNMGGAIARGLKVSDMELCCADRSTEILNLLKSDNPAIKITNDNCEAVKDADIVIIAVKPWLVEAVIHEIKQNLDYRKQIVISIAAGVTFEKLCSFLKKEDAVFPALYRIIPNTAIEVRESVNFISSYHNTSPEQTATVKSLFDRLGTSFLIEERLLNAGMALASCGIAYAFRYIRAAIEGAVELGLSPEQAKRIEMQTLKGAVALLEANNRHPEAEIDKVTTPGGITIKGLNAMEEAGFTNAVIKGLKASV